MIKKLLTLYFSLLTLPIFCSKDDKVQHEDTAPTLSYKIINEGCGPSPKLGQEVTVNYTGWLDKDGKAGTKFDSSVDKGQPLSFIIGTGQVIKGWDLGVKNMKVGDKIRLWVPSSLAYGTRGASNVIPPNANLIFDIELLKIA